MSKRAFTIKYNLRKIIGISILSVLASLLLSVIVGAVWVESGWVGIVGLGITLLFAGLIVLALWLLDI